MTEEKLTPVQQLEKAEADLVAANEKVSELEAKAEEMQATIDGLEAAKADQAQAVESAEAAKAESEAALETAKTEHAEALESAAGELNAEKEAHAATSDKLEAAAKGLANPAFAAAAVEACKDVIPEGSAEAGETLTKAEAMAEYKAIEDPQARKEYREAHAEILGLK